MVLWADIAGLTALWITAAHHLFNCFLNIVPLVSQYPFPVIIPPPFPMVDKYLAELVAAVLRERLKQQSRHFSIRGNGQHALAGINVRDIIEDTIFGLLIRFDFVNVLGVLSHGQPLILFRTLHMALNLFSL